jgi:hypothetical protein
MSIAGAGFGLEISVRCHSEFHAETTWSRGGSTPVQIVHGGRHMRASWLEVDVFGSDHLELTL